VAQVKTVSPVRVQPFDGARLYSCAQAAEVLSVSRWTPQRWITERRVRGVRVGRSLRIPGADLNALIEMVGPDAGDLSPTE
jgi:excisionase family DNA binding protein